MPCQVVIFSRCQTEGKKRLLYNEYSIKDSPTAEIPEFNNQLTDLILRSTLNDFRDAINSKTDVLRFDVFVKIIGISPLDNYVSKFIRLEDFKDDDQSIENFK